MSVLSEARALEAAEDELLAEHSGENDRDYAEYRRPGGSIAFAEEVLHFQCYEKQKEVLLAFERHKKVVVRGCHGAGKDAILSVIALYAHAVLGMLVVVVSATEPQLLDQTWREISERFRASDLPGKLYMGDLRINGRKRILTRTSNSVNNLTGYHDSKGVAVLISESQSEQTQAAAFDAADANTIDPLSKIVVVGNPVVPDGRFFEVSRKATWHAIRISAFDHPNVIEQRMVISGGPAPDWPAEMEAEYGKDSAWYAARVLGEFPEQAIERLIRREWIDNAIQLWQDRKFAVVVSQSVPFVVADIARGGPDETCLGVIRGNPKAMMFDALEPSREPDTMVTTQTLVDRSRELGRWRIPRARPTPEDVVRHQVPIVCDDNGIGGGVTDRARELRASVIPFNGSHRSEVVDPKTRKEKYLNLRCESYFVTRDALRDGRLALPPDEKMVEELLAIQFSLNGAGLFVVEPKKEIKKRIKRSPDRADVVTMGTWAVATRQRLTASVFTFRC